MSDLVEALREYESSFALRMNADTRAIKKWQEETGRKLVWPDHADLCGWLLKENDRLKAKLKQAADAIGHKPDCKIFAAKCSCGAAEKQAQALHDALEEVRE